MTPTSACSRLHPRWWLHLWQPAKLAIRTLGTPGTTRSHCIRVLSSRLPGFPVTPGLPRGSYPGRSQRRFPRPNRSIALGSTPRRGVRWRPYSRDDQWRECGRILRRASSRCTTKCGPLFRRYCTECVQNSIAYTRTARGRRHLDRQGQIVAHTENSPCLTTLQQKQDVHKMT